MQMPSPLAGVVLKDIPALPGAEMLLPSQQARILYWLYRKRIPAFSFMKDIPMSFRNRMAESFVPGWDPPVQLSGDSSGTEKYFFPVSAGGCIETVYIPDGKRKTLCVSVQSGCRMGCRFCVTGSLPWQGSITAGEILNQLVSVPESLSITHIVIMGMGEAFDNEEEVFKALEILQADWGFGFSPARITVSTVGIIPGMERLIAKYRCHLAYSLHSPFSEQRKQWIPAERKYPLHSVIKLLANYPVRKRSRFSAEYAMIAGENDTDAHLAELINLLKGKGIRVNLIPFNPVPHLPWISSDSGTIRHFMLRLNEAGIPCTIRKSRGQDIGAACGLLGRTPEGIL